MFTNAGSYYATLLKPVGLLLAVRILQGLGLVGDVFSWFSFYLNQLYSATYGAITGQDSTWLFFNDGAPVQMKYTRSMTRDSPWWYNQRTREWVRRGTQYGERGHTLPFVMCTLHTPDGEYDLTEFFSAHKYYFPNCRHVFPTPEQLLSSWSIESHIWLTDTQKDASYYTIMGGDCNDYRIPIVMYDDNVEEWATYNRLFGVEESESESESESGEEESGEEESGEEESGEEESGEEESGEEESGSEESGSEEEKSGEEESGSGEEESGSGEEESGSGEEESGSGEEESGSGEEESGSGEEESGEDATSAEKEKPTDTATEETTKSKDD